MKRRSRGAIVRLCFRVSRTRDDSANHQIPRLEKRGRISDFSYSEIVHGLVEDELKSVRQLARQVGLFPTVIQDIRSGGRTNVTLRSFLGIVSALGGQVAVRKGKQEMVLRQ
jgi:hypothetical protein